MSKKRSTILMEAIRNFEGTKYDTILDEMSISYIDVDYDAFDASYENLPTPKDLLETLLKKLKKKSIYVGLRKVLEGKDDSIEQSIISISSLITHCTIEVKENKEYKQLLPDLYKKLGVLIKKL